MAIRQRKDPAGKRKPEMRESSDSDEDAVSQKEYHTEPSDDEDEPEEEPLAEEFHTDPEDASPEPETDTPLLPTALLKAKPSTPGVRIEWDKMSQKERKALRDELGLSMRELRSEAQRNGVIDAGRMAQLKRGIRPAEKVAGGRIAKSKRRGAKPTLSGKQKLIEQKSRETRKRNAKGGEQRTVKKRKG